jgi:hypothetical protein
MYRNNDFIYDAVTRLGELSGLPIEIESVRQEYDALISVLNTQFIIQSYAEIRSSNKGVILSKIKALRTNSRKPILVVAKYIAAEIASEFKASEINYLDVAGNVYIKHDPVFLFISGQKSERIATFKQSRAFQESGIKLIFNLLKTPDNLQLSYRELSELTDVSIGSVSNIMQELESLKFVLKTKSKRILKNKRELLDRWIVAYNDVLRPRLLKKKMRFAKDTELANWKSIPLNKMDGVCQWGGEPAGALKTDYLSPEKFTLYTTLSWQNLINELNMVPDENGNIEVLSIFWATDKTTNSEQTVPAVLIYADLVTSGFSRNIETADIILENELQYIK